MSDKPKCFIIMPLTTPVEHTINYAGDDEHFKHVLEHLFLPAVEQAGFEPVKPIAKGSENIQARIIKKLETADIVLCDMSILNPNVFFEFGIRTALNKPICVVVDDKTPKVPFDTGTINYYRYNSSMLKWDVEVEIQNLINHIKESKEQIEDGNSLWKYFSMQTVAKPLELQNGVEGKVEIIMSQLEVINRRLDKNENNNAYKPPFIKTISALNFEPLKFRKEKIFPLIEKANDYDIHIINIMKRDEDILFLLDKQPERKTLIYFIKEIEKSGFTSDKLLIGTGTESEMNLIFRKGEFFK